MVGALALASRTRRRRRYADGGDVGEDPGRDVYDYAVTSDSAASAPPQSEAQRGALSEAAQTDNTADAIDRGTRNLGAQVRQQQVNSILAASGQQPSPLFQVPPNNVITDPSQAPGATNLPMLAAAGAFLKPTHSGGFSEALGNAFSATVPEIEKQRALSESAQLRKAQMDQTAAIWGGRLGVQQDRANTYRDSVAGRLAVQQRQADLKEQGLTDTAAWRQATLELGQGKLDALVTHYGNQDTNAQERTNIYGQNTTNRASLLTAQTALATARANALNNPKATAASIQQDAVNAMMEKINPDTNQPYTPDEAYMYVRGTTQRLAQGDRRLDQGDTRLAQRAEQIRNTQEYHDAQLALRAKIGDNTNANAVMARATTLSASTGQALSKSVDQVLSQMGRTRNAVPPITPPTPQRQSAAPAPAAGGNALVEQARAAIAAGAPRDAVIQRLKEQGGDPSGL